MKRVLSLFLIILLVIQTITPSLALEETEVLSERSDSEIIQEQPDSIPEDNGLSSDDQTSDIPEEDNDTAVQPETPDTEADPDIPAPSEDTEETPVDPEEVPEPASAEEDELADVPEEEDEFPDVPEPELYNGQEADYDDPQFLKLLADGFFNDSGIATVSESSYTHDSRFKGYEVKKGVDVSKWNGTINWTKVANDGIDFALIRCGNRTSSGGSLSSDPDFATNMKGALAAGLDVGVYIFSQAITEAEAREEAKYALNLCAGYSFDLPIVMDYEYYPDGRLEKASLSKTQRTNICNAFCQVIEAAGYSAMVYANKSMLTDDMYGQKLADAGYQIWLAQWRSSTTYTGTYTYWQYTDQGSVNGIANKVDMNFYYKLPDATINYTYSTVNGVRLAWNAVSLADQYRIYRKTGSESQWKLLATVSGSNTVTYVDQTAAAGTTYRYTVQACAGAVRGEYDRAGTSVTYQPQISLSSAQVKSNGVSLTWKTFASYDGYRILRRTGTTGNWSVLAEITDAAQTAYLDTASNLSSGVTYSYTICGMSKGNPSVYDQYGLQVVWLSTPSLISAASCATGMKVTWTQVSGASGYNVYRADAGHWKKIAVITSGSTTSYVDTSATTPNAVYTYTVRALLGNSLSDYVRSGVTGIQVPSPQLTAAKASTNGITVTWNAVSGASKYRIFRRTASTNWIILDTVDNVTQYCDTKAEFGTLYSYTVRANNGGCWSWYDKNGVSAMRLETPVLKSASRVAKGVSVTWNSVKGAAGYFVFRKSTGTWQLIATVAQNSYIDTAQLTENSIYRYTVRAYYDKNNISGYQTAGVQFYALATPTLTKIAITSNGITVSWNAVTGATGYVIFRKTTTSGWTRLANLGTTTSYTDTTPESGVTYIYTVRASYSGFLSWYDTKGISILYLATPVLKSAVWKTSGIAVSWQAVPGASGYRVYRKVIGGSWKALANITSTAYLDKTELEEGTQYLYTVRAYSGSTLSSYNPAGLKYTHLPTPKLSSAANNTTGITICWNAVSGATHYAVYRRSGTSGWILLKTFSGSTNYTDTTVTSGVSYTYTVRARVDGSWSGYDSAGISCLCLATPTLQSAKWDETGVQLSWEAVPGAYGYRVFRKINGKWTTLANVTDTTYMDGTASMDEANCYTVRAFYGTTWSNYDHNGILSE